MKKNYKIILCAAVVLLAVLGAVLWYLESSGWWVARQAASGDLSDRIEAVALLRGKGGSLARETLLRLSEDKELRVALAAVRAMGAHEAHREALVRICAKGDRGLVRAAAVAALGKFEDTPSADLIAILKTDKDPVVRAGAVEGLAHKRDAQTTEALLAAMDDNDLTVRRKAMAALYRSMGLRFLYRPDDPRLKRRADIAKIRRLIRQIVAGVHR
ncbi:hypothetical protein LCGC14_2859950 [marine sediment metagenome]|uniref:HEAT repeat domain-containing protein n=1 Tax=marine sediment metagenome TaxID=412755 RepID=A0A0F8YSN1_9ZZZZ